MEFEFCSRAEVTYDTYSKKWKAVLTVGLVCSLFSMLIEFAINRKFAGIFVIPVIYMLYFRRKMRITTSIQDVKGIASSDGKIIRIMLFDVIKSRKGSFDRMLTIEKAGISYYWNADLCELGMKGKATIVILNKENRILAGHEIKDDWLYLYIDEKYLKKFKILFSTTDDGERVYDSR